jgi:2-polyprenyl-3-methyl-5-hydroxy-6-metoxy-1,4-benzoquinol methylase
MKQPVPQPDWPESWRKSFLCDCKEVFGARSDPHYTILYQNRLRRVLDLMKRHALPGAKILDLAAAQGNYTLTLAESGYDVTWNDIRAELADYVKLKYEFGTIAYKAGNAFELIFSECFDVVLALELIEHVAHPDVLLQQTLRLVKPGGFLIISTPNGGYFRHHGPKFSGCKDSSVYEEMQFKPDADGHIFCLNPNEVQQLARNAGLEVIELALFNTVSTMGHLKLRYLHLPMWLIWLFERSIQLTSMKLREKTCAAMLFAGRRSSANGPTGKPK